MANISEPPRPTPPENQLPRWVHESEMYGIRRTGLEQTEFEKMWMKQERALDKAETDPETCRYIVVHYLRKEKENRLNAEQKIDNENMIMPQLQADMSETQKALDTNSRVNAEIDAEIQQRRRDEEIKEKLARAQKAFSRDGRDENAR